MASMGVLSPAVLSLALALALPCVVQVALKGQGQLLPMVSSNKNFDHVLDGIGGQYARTAMAVPLHASEGELLGVLEALNKQARPPSHACPRSSPAPSRAPPLCLSPSQLLAGRSVCVTSLAQGRAASNAAPRKSTRGGAQRHMGACWGGGMDLHLRVMAWCRGWLYVEYLPMQSPGAGVGLGALPEAGPYLRLAPPGCGCCLSHAGLHQAPLARQSRGRGVGPL